MSGPVGAPIKVKLEDVDSFQGMGKQLIADVKVSTTKEGMRNIAMGDESKYADIKKIEVVQDGSKKQKAKAVGASALYKAQRGTRCLKNCGMKLKPDDEKNLQAKHAYHRDVWRWRHSTCCQRIKAGPGMICRMLCRQPRNIHNFIFYLPAYFINCCCGCCPCTPFWLRKYLGEFFGTMLLTMAWGLSNTYAGDDWAPLASGAALMVAVYTTGPISGGHLNPAVTCAVCCADRMETVDCLGWICQCTPTTYYIVWQILGAMFGGMFASAMMEDSMPTIDIRDDYSMTEAWMVEFIYTLLVQSVVLNCALALDAQGRQFQGLAQGMARMGAAFAISPITGAALNPAVMLGINGYKYLNEFALYVSAHITASIGAAFIFRMVRREEYGAQSNLFHKCIAEFMGSMWIMATFGFCDVTQPDSLRKAMAVGGVATAVFYMFSYKSGGHFNPVVTLTAWSTGRKVNSKISCWAYIGAQLLGSIGGTLCYYTTLNKVFNVEAGPIGRFDVGKWYSVFWAEAFFTSFMCFTYTSIWMTKHIQKWKADFAGLVVGNAFFMTMLSCQLISGAHMNPAISFAAAMCSTMKEGNFSNMWPYIFAQLFGVVIATALFYLARPEEEPSPGFKEWNFNEEFPPEEIDHPGESTAHWERDEGFGGQGKAMYAGDEANMALELMPPGPAKSAWETESDYSTTDEVIVKSFSGKRKKVPPSLDVESIESGGLHFGVVPDQKKKNRAKASKPQERSEGSGEVIRL